MACECDILQNRELHRFTPRKRTAQASEVAFGLEGDRGHHHVARLSRAEVLDRQELTRELEVPAGVPTGSGSHTST